MPTKKLLVIVFCSLLFGLIARSERLLFASDRSRIVSFQVPVLTANTEVFSGPGDDYYVTGYLGPGEMVEVFVRYPDGWCAIRPPQGSFSWINGRFVQPLSDGRGVVSAEVGSQEVPVRVGADSVVKSTAIQVGLRTGKQIKIRGETRLPGNILWYKIAPPPGEFRYVHEEDLRLGQVADQIPAQLMLQGDYVEMIDNATQITQVEPPTLHSQPLQPIAAEQTRTPRVLPGPGPAPVAIAPLTSEQPENNDGWVGEIEQLPDNFTIEMARLQRDLFAVISRGAVGQVYDFLKERAKTLHEMAKTDEQRIEAQALYHRIHQFQTGTGVATRGEWKGESSPKIVASQTGTPNANPVTNPTATSHTESSLSAMRPFWSPRPKPEGVNPGTAAPGVTPVAPVVPQIVASVPTPAIHAPLQANPQNDADSANRSLGKYVSRGRSGKGYSGPPTLGRLQFAFTPRQTTTLPGANIAVNPATNPIANPVTNPVPGVAPTQIVTQQIPPPPQLPTFNPTPQRGIPLIASANPSRIVPPLEYKPVPSPSGELRVESRGLILSPVAPPPEPISPAMPEVVTELALPEPAPTPFPMVPISLPPIPTSAPAPENPAEQELPSPTITHPVLIGDEIDSIRPVSAMIPIPPINCSGDSEIIPSSYLAPAGPGNQSKGVTAVNRIPTFLPDHGVFDAVGVLGYLPDSPEGTPKYALVERKGDEVRILCYIQSESGKSLEQFVGKTVGVKGSRALIRSDETSQYLISVQTIFCLK